MPMSRFALLTFTLVLLAAPLSAQTIYLSEDFSSPNFPPPGWIEDRMGANQNGWKLDGNGRAWHEDYTNPTTENRLVSPAFSLVGATEAYLHFQGETNYATYLANHPNSVGDGISSFEVSVDGGLTWNLVWTDTSQNNGTYAPSLDLNTYLGAPTVQVGVYFYGSFAQEWWVDNIFVDDTPVPIITTMINPANGNPYTLLGASDRGTAAAMAQSLGGTLVTVADQAENDWIRSNLATFGGLNREIWLGYTDVAFEGTWVWDTNEPNLYENWAPGEPNDGGSGEDHAVITTSGQWNDVGAGYSAYGIVEISGARLDYTPIVAGQLATFAINGMRQDSSVVFLFSTTGPGPINSPFGPLEVDPGFLMTPTFPSIVGSFDFSSYIPLNLQGATLYSQAVELFSGGGGEPSDAVALPIQ
jgi:hypothetical protein